MVARAVHGSGRVGFNPTRTRPGSVFDPTRTQPVGVGWRGGVTRIRRRKNRSVQFSVMVSVDRVVSVAGIKKGIEI